MVPLLVRVDRVVAGHLGALGSFCVVISITLAFRSD